MLKKAPCLLVLTRRTPYHRPMASLSLRLNEICNRDPRQTTVHGQTLLATILKRVAPLSSRSPLRRTAREAGEEVSAANLAAPPTKHLPTTTDRHRPPISPKAAPSARTTTPAALPRPNRRSGLSPEEVGGGRGERQTTMVPPRR
jgi:hypothetical protein